jgi:hypothetical protein
MLFKKRKPCEYVNTYKNIDIFRISEKKEIPLFMFKINNTIEQGKMDFLIKRIDHIVQNQELDLKITNRHEWYRLYKEQRQEEEDSLVMTFRGVEIYKKPQADARHYCFKFYNYKLNEFENFRFYNVDSCTNEIDKLFEEFEQYKFDEFKKFYKKMIDETFGNKELDTQTEKKEDATKV